MTTRVFVYAIGTVDGPVKVGITSNLFSRLRSLQNGSAKRLELLFVYTCEDRKTAQAMEREFHEAHATWRLEGEWFDLPAIVAEEGLQWLIEMSFDPRKHPRLYMDLKEWRRDG